MLTVAELWRHPVKSMQGHLVDHVEIDHRGVSLISTTSLRAWEHRRFRMNVVL
jgi:MOSC N-terminal beta barrel domain